MSRILSSFGLRIINRRGHIALREPSLVGLVCSRGIFNGDSLGVYKVDQLQKNYQKFKDVSNIERIRARVHSGEHESLLVEDLITMLRVADNEDDLDLIEKMFKNIKCQDADLCGWSAMLMRLYYKMNMVDRAYSTMTNLDDHGQKVFGLTSTYRIVMTMLYDAGRYHDVLNLYNSFKKLDFPASTLNQLVPIASLAKIGTPDALDEAMKIYEREQRNSYIKLRLVNIISYLAYQNGQYAVALNLMTDPFYRRHIVSNSIKMLCLFRLKRFEDLLTVYDQVTAVETKKELITCDARDYIRDHIDEIEDEDTRHRITHMLKNLEDRVGQMSIEEITFSPIKPPRRRGEMKPSESGVDDIYRGDSDELYDQEGHRQRQQGSSRFLQGRFRENYLDRDHRVGDRDYRGGDRDYRGGDRDYRQPRYDRESRRSTYGSESRRSNYDSDFRKYNYDSELS